MKSRSDSQFTPALGGEMHASPNKETIIVRKSILSFSDVCYF